MSMIFVACRFIAGFRLVGFGDVVTKLFMMQMPPAGFCSLSSLTRLEACISPDDSPVIIYNRIKKLQKSLKNH